MTTHTELITVDPDNRFEVKNTDSVKPFIPAGFQSVLRFAELIHVSGMAPKDMQTVDKIAVAIFHGMEVGMTPMASLQSIAIINGRPSIWGDGALAMIRASGELEDIEEYYEGDWLLADGKTINTEFKAICVVKRKGAKRSITNEFSVADAQRALLWGKSNTPWVTYPKRMLKMRARSWAIRDEFTDIMRGLVLAEEAQDYDDMRNVSPKEEPPVPPEGAKARGRKPREAANKYQDDGGKGDVGDKSDIEDAEVISQTAAGGAKEKVKEEDEDAPVPGKNVAAKPAETPPVETGPSPKEVADNEANVFLDELLSRVGADKPLKEHLKYLHRMWLPLTTSEEAKNAWFAREKLKGEVKSQSDFITELRVYHKERIGKIEEDANEDPPAKSTKKEPVGKDEPQFDYAGFLHELETTLGTAKTADDVNKFYAEMTDAPIAAGLITEAQRDSDLQPLWEAALERASY
jgi:hypothetical protein